MPFIYTANINMRLLLLFFLISTQAFAAQISSKFIQDSAITTIKIANTAVTSGKMNSESSPSGYVPTSNGVGGVSWAAQTGGTGGGLNASWVLENAVIPYASFDGPRYVKTAKTLTTVFLSILNSGLMGGTYVQANQYRAGVFQGSAIASIPASNGNPSGIEATLSSSLSLQVGDILTWTVTQIPTGAPESLSCEY